MMEGLELQNAQAVIEYGPGTGALTQHVLERLSKDAKFAAIEVNSEFAEEFRKRFPGVPLFVDSVANVRAICDGAGITMADCIVSGLPWAVFPQNLQVAILDEMMKVLKPGGTFVTFAYVHGLTLPPGKRFAALLREYFTTVSKSPVVWRNVPPAFVYRCRR